MLFMSNLAFGIYITKEKPMYALLLSNSGVFSSPVVLGLAALAVLALVGFVLAINGKKKQVIDLRLNHLDSRPPTPPQT